jgi:major type 1 subunit fimbrin (pilin)
MKSLSPAIAVAAAGLLGLASFGAHAADGTITFTGSIADTTCSINGAATGATANKTIALAPVSSGTLSEDGAIAGTSSAADLTLTLSGCGVSTTKAIARFENGPTVDQTRGNLVNATASGSATNVQVRLLNSQMQPINIATNANNLIATNATPVSGGSATLKYYAQYYATGKASAGTVNTSVQYTMQYQ